MDTSPRPGHAAAVSSVGWRSRVGAWIGCGASPGALLLGAGIAARHDGPAPLVAVIAGAALMAALLWGQGLLGLAPPTGAGTTLNALAERNAPPPPSPQTPPFSEWGHTFTDPRLGRVWWMRLRGFGGAWR